MARIQWPEVFKFLSGAAFVGAITNIYLWAYGISLPFLGYVIPPWFLGVRGAVGAVLCIVFFYFGYLRKR
jgi:hypothetical protein